MDLKKGDGSETFALHALVGLRKTFVNDVDFELHHGAQRHIVRHRRHKRSNHLVDVVIPGVLDCAELAPTEIGRAAHKVLGRESEQPLFGVFLFALGVGIENQVDDFLVQPPRRGEVEFEIEPRVTSWPLAWFIAKATSLIVAPQSFWAIVPHVWRNV